MEYPTLKVCIYYEYYYLFFEGSQEFYDVIFQSHIHTHTYKRSKRSSNYRISMLKMHDIYLVEKKNQKPLLIVWRQINESICFVRIFFVNFNCNNYVECTVIHISMTLSEISCIWLEYLKFIYFFEFWLFIATNFVTKLLVLTFHWQSMEYLSIKIPFKCGEWKMDLEICAFCIQIQFVVVFVWRFVFFLYPMLSQHF